MLRIRTRKAYNKGFQEPFNRNQKSNQVSSYTTSCLLGSCPEQGRSSFMKNFKLWRRVMLIADEGFEI